MGNYDESKNSCDSIFTSMNNHLKFRFLEIKDRLKTEYTAYFRKKGTILIRLIPAGKAVASLRRPLCLSGATI
jgi:hypothetical protein